MPRCEESNCCRKTEAHDYMVEFASAVRGKHGKVTYYIIAKCSHCDFYHLNKNSDYIVISEGDKNKKLLVKANLWIFNPNKVDHKFYLMSINDEMVEQGLRPF